jgi:hypothetical protein
VTLAAVAGGNYIGECCDMMASLIGCSVEAMVIDNHMLGNIQTVLKGIDVTDETLSFDEIARAISGPGDYLGSPKAPRTMETEYLYPHRRPRFQERLAKSRRPRHPPGGAGQGAGDSVDALSGVYRSRHRCEAARAASDSAAGKKICSRAVGGIEAREISDPDDDFLFLDSILAGRDQPQAGHQHGFDFQ